MAAVVEDQQPADRRLDDRRVGHAEGVEVGRPGCHDGVVVDAEADRVEAHAAHCRPGVDAASVAGTRARIRDAATRLFVERGYVATTMREIAAAAGVGERTLYAAFATKAALFTHTLVEAAGADPDMRAAADAGAEATHRVHLALTTALHERHALRAGLDPVTAPDTLYALASPHLHQLLRRHRGWLPDRYAAWLENAAVRELLD